MDNLENKMKHTKVDGVIPRLFEGKMIVIVFFLFFLLSYYEILIIW